MSKRSVVKVFDDEPQSDYRKKRPRKKVPQSTGLELKQISPITEAQDEVFESYADGQHMNLIGCAGTGKTFLACYLSLKDLLNNESDKTQIIIIRSCVPTRSIGHLPGSAEEKASQYEAPYIDIFNEICGRADAYGILKLKSKVVFTTTSFIRGITWNDSIIILDESQNTSFQELHSVMTRVGKNSRVILCGDIKQDDLTSKRYNEESGLPKLQKIVDKMKSFDTIVFESSDIVRSGFVREYIEACESVE